MPGSRRAVEPRYRAAVLARAVLARFSFNSVVRRYIRIILTLQRKCAKIKRRIERIENVHFHSCTFCPRIPLRRFKFLFFCIFSVPTQRNADEIRQLRS